MDVRLDAVGGISTSGCSAKSLHTSFRHRTHDVRRQFAQKTSSGVRRLLLTVGYCLHVNNRPLLTCQAACLRMECGLSSDICCGSDNLCLCGNRSVWSPFCIKPADIAAVSGTLDRSCYNQAAGRPTNGQLLNPIAKRVSRPNVVLKPLAGIVRFAAQQGRTGELQR